MKKTIMAAWLCAAAFCVQAQESGAVLSQFKSSPEFERVQKQFNELGEPDFGEAMVNYVEANGKHPYGTLYFRREGQITAVLEFVPLPEKAERLLPNNDRYAMQLIDYREYDEKNLSGTIRAYDLNYDNFLMAELEVEKGLATRFDALHIPDEVLKKYEGLNQSGNDNDRKAHLCDANGNGNISFFECYRCMIRVCKGDPECNFLCTLINQASGHTPIPKQCNLSMAASCVIISVFM